MTLYLKYRPKNLDELDLPEVSESLKKIVNSGKIPHAFLFAGPKGTGKTSAARILAKIINCESKNPPCDKCEQCISITKGNNLDVIEMDAASHRGIDDVRVLRDAVKLAPVAAKKKIYIIDEAHMLTTEASNALLKTLEEPPEHVIFILATTNPEKLIETIRSRTTYVPFRKATVADIVRSLKRVIEGEKIKVDPAALNIIAEAADGAFRDAIKILEQLILEKRELSKDFLEEYLLSKKIFDIEKFSGLLLKKDLKNLLSEIGNLEKNGASVEVFITQLIGSIRGRLLADTSDKSLIELLEVLLDANAKISDSPIETLPLEIAVIKWCDGEGGSQDPAQTVEPVIRSQTTASLEEMKAGIESDIWKNILNLVKPVNASVEALLRAAKPIGYDGKTLTLGVYYKFHKERLEDAKHRMVLEQIINKVLGSPTRIVCTLTDPPPPKIIEETKMEPILTEGRDADIIKVAEEIFGN